MRKIILYSAVSMDGFIAKKDGGIDWLHSPELAVEGEDYGYSEFYSRIDCTLMGNKTYEQVNGFDIPFPYPDKTNYVFTRTPSKADTEFVQFVDSDIITFVRGLRQQAGKDIWLIGGGQINAILHQAGLVDEFILSVIPITLGEGIPLFDGPSSEFKLDLISHKAYATGIVELQYYRVPKK